MSDRIPEESPNGKAGGSDPAGLFIPDNGECYKSTAKASDPRQLDLSDAGIDLPTGADLAAAAVDRMDATASEATRRFIADCNVALTLETAIAPCSMAEARFRHGVKVPDGVEGRSAAVASRQLRAAGIIESAGFCRASPWRCCHASNDPVWRRPSRGGAS